MHGATSALVALRDLIYRGASESMADRLSRMSPQEMASIMGKVPESQRSIALKALLRGSGQAVGLSVPGALNAQ